MYQLDSLMHQVIDREHQIYLSPMFLNRRHKLSSTHMYNKQTQECFHTTQMIEGFALGHRFAPNPEVIVMRNSCLIAISYAIICLSVLLLVTTFLQMHTHTQRCEVKHAVSHFPQPLM